MAVYSFAIEAMVRGYHVYQSIWDAAIDGENLECFREVGNIHDPSAVAIRKDGSVVGHVPRALSAVCSSFIRRGGLILCRVSGSRRYSADLPQGGLEVPCVLTFRTSNAKDVEKVKKLIDQESISFSTLIKVGVIKKTEDLNFLGPKLDSSANSCSVVNNAKNLEKCSTTVLKDCTNSRASLVSDNVDDHEPLAKRQRLSDPEIEELIMGAELSDRHINLAQKILKEQFPNLNGLNSTLLQLKQQKLTEDMVKNKLQIIHCSERHHWVTASTVKTAPGVVIVVDSLFKSIDTETKSIILNLFQHNIVSEPRIKLVRSQQQKGSKDCGVFAIAMATTIALERNPSNVTFHQELMRAHLVDCLEKRKFTFFP